MQQRATGRGRLPRLQTVDSWAKYRNYRFLWTANFCANSAQWLQLLTVGWLVHDLTQGSASSPFQVITVGGLATLPVLFVGPWAGVLGDRVDRRKLLMATHTVLATIAAIFALLVATDRIQDSWHVYIYVLASGAFRTITMLMQQSLIANTVPREALANAFAINVFTIPGTRIMGPFVGGILIATLGFAWNFAIEAALYATAVLMLIWVRTPLQADGSGSPAVAFVQLEGGNPVYLERREGHVQPGDTGTHPQRPLASGVVPHTHIHLRRTGQGGRLRRIPCSYHRTWWVRFSPGHSLLRICLQEGDGVPYRRGRKRHLCHPLCPIRMAYHIFRHPWADGLLSGDLPHPQWRSDSASGARFPAGPNYQPCKTTAKDSSPSPACLSDSSPGTPTRLPWRLPWWEYWGWHWRACSSLPITRYASLSRKPEG